MIVMKRKAAVLQNLFHNMIKAKFTPFLFTTLKILNTLVLSLWEVKIMIFRLFMILVVPIYGLIQLNVEMLDAKIISSMMAKEVPPIKN